jgi:hypothetical protein
MLPVQMDASVIGDSICADQPLWQLKSSLIRWLSSRPGEGGQTLRGELMVREKTRLACLDEIEYQSVPAW